MKNKRLKIIVPILIVIEVISIFLAWKSHSDIPTLEDKKETNEVNRKQFAMFTRDSEDLEYTEYTGEDLFPKGYKLNTDQSSCMDINGDEVTTENIITQTNDGKIMVTSTKTVYCTFYFDKESTASETLTTNPSSYLKEGDHGDLHWRYVGTQEQSSSINNYVCFGAASCSDQTDNHMYRIIGITTDNKIKIQKNKALSSNVVWHSSRNKILWSQSDVYQITLMQTFYEDSSLVSDSMKDKIDTEHQWNIGDVGYEQFSDGPTAFEKENGDSKHTGAVGLAYLSDYYFAYNVGGTQNCNIDPFCKSWMIPINYVSLWSNQSYEWTMTRYGRDVSSNYYAWRVRYDGVATNYYLDNTHAVRPVFYLNSDVTISGGEGTLDSPFIIN